MSLTQIGRAARHHARPVSFLLQGCKADIACLPWALGSRERADLNPLAVRHDLLPIVWVAMELKLLGRNVKRWLHQVRARNAVSIVLAPPLPWRACFWPRQRAFALTAGWLSPVHPPAA